MASSHHVPCYYELLNRLFQVVFKEKQPGINRERKLCLFELQSVAVGNQTSVFHRAGFPRILSRECFRSDLREKKDDFRHESISEKKIHMYLNKICHDVR